MQKSLRGEEWVYTIPTEKKLFDFTFTSIGIIPILPIMGFIALLIKLEDGGSIIFKQERIGYRFLIIKVENTEEYLIRELLRGKSNINPLRL